jgi:hypothetical protein
MGLFWDLIQQSQISQQQDRTSDLGERVARLESELDRTREMLHSLLVLLERHLGEDLDHDGRVG